MADVSPSELTDMISAHSNSPNISPAITPLKLPESASHVPRVGGLDTLRFVAAFSVLLSHVLSEPPIFHWFGLDPTVGILKIIQGIYWKFFYTGISGVMVFFVISGLCIHLPHSVSLRIPSLKGYYYRRLLRILPPIVPIVLFYHFADGITLGNSINQTILWSVVCEVFYYIFYPFLLIIRRNRKGWGLILFVSYAASICVLLSDPRAHSYQTFGPWLTWILGLPCWLLGAVLAEKIQKLSQPTVTIWSIWAWRLGIWCLAASCVVLAFKTPFKDPWTMNLFAVVAFFWIHREIIHFRTHPPLQILESFGLWSFSLYITHHLFWENWQNYWGMTKPFGFFEYLGTLGAILLFAYIYYLIIEQPTHKLSRAVAKIVGRA